MLTNPESTLRVQATRTGAEPELRFELRFRALTDAVQGCSFPCDAQGHVDLDALSERARNIYFYARIVIGHAFAPPQVHRVTEMLANMSAPLRDTPLALTT